MSHPVCLDDFERCAETILPASILSYYRSGANKEKTLEWNCSAFDKYVLRPRVLRDVTNVDMSTTLLGRTIAFPVGLSPTALQCMAHSEGEKATVRAVAAMDTCMILSSHSTHSLEEVSKAGTPFAHLWFQLYIYKDRTLTEKLVRRAEAAGYLGLVLTVDTPIWGSAYMYATKRHKFEVPPHLKCGNFVTEAKNEPYVASYFETMSTPDDIRWLMSITKLPIVLKGILTGEDAKIAADLGVAGIMVSNHGGRQLDSVPATIDVLAEVAAAVSHKPACEIYMDGGIRTGVDVLKALLLGARAVFIGRPVIWALAHSGETGLVKMLQLLKEEVRVGMSLLGASSIANLEQKMIARRANM